MAAALRFSPFEALITLSGLKIKASLVTPGTWLRGNKQPNLPRVDPGQAGPAVITALELPSSSEEPGWGGHGGEEWWRAGNCVCFCPWIYKRKQAVLRGVRKTARG